jgi:hypothetical protein
MIIATVDTDTYPSTTTSVGADDEEIEIRECRGGGGGGSTTSLHCCQFIRPEIEPPDGGGMTLLSLYGSLSGIGSDSVDGEHVVPTSLKCGRKPTVSFGTTGQAPPAFERSLASFGCKQARETGDLLGDVSNRPWETVGTVRMLYFDGRATVSVSSRRRCIVDVRPDHRAEVFRCQLRLGDNGDMPMTVTRLMSAVTPDDYRTPAVVVENPMQLRLPGGT